MTILFIASLGNIIPAKNIAVDGIRRGESVNHGIHKPKHLLVSYMNRNVTDSIESSSRFEMIRN